MEICLLKIIGLGLEIVISRHSHKILNIVIKRIDYLCRTYMLNNLL